MREEIEQIYREALKGINPETRVVKQLSSQGWLTETGGQIYLVAFGKAACPMTRGALSVLGNRLKRGIVITKDDHSKGFNFPDRVELYEASHPVPDLRSVRATERALEILDGLRDDDLVIALISGGGSSLFCAPFEGISLEDKKTTTDLLLKAGADIFEINTVRKHISRVKGGRLARYLSPAKVISLIISDVIGNRLDVIASGPTAPDPTTFSDALEVIKKYGLYERVPEGVIKLLKRGASGEVPETLKPGSRVFERVENHIIASNRHMLEELKALAEKRGYRTLLLTDSLQGEAREAARWLAGEIKRTSSPTPLCLISGGETTVTVKGDGLGGRNTEFALAFAMEIEGMKGVTLLSAGTDGTDGPTDAAGAVVDGETTKRARALGLDPMDYLLRNDSYNFFKNTGELLITGPTGTNVMDIQIVLIRP
ncbi:MAG: glycerate kinase [Nitrospirae bacterium]|nr:MAG: glycerate kinase [Nitrospirota bacterium]